MAAKVNAAGAPTPWPYPTMIGVLNSIAEIGADPVTVRNSTPPRPTAPLRSLGTSARWEMSKDSSIPSIPPTRGSSDCAMSALPRGSPSYYEVARALRRWRQTAVAKQRRSDSGGQAGVKRLKRALWYRSQRGRYQQVEIMTRVLVHEIWT